MTKYTLRIRCRPSHLEPLVAASPGSRTLTVTSYIPLAVLVVGATAARPIADDYGIEAKLTSHGAFGAVSWWVAHWSAYYSNYGVLTVAAAVTRASGQDIYFESVMALAMLAGLLMAVRSSLRWCRASGTTTVLVSTGLLGSFATIAEPGQPVLYSAVYWASAWVSHLVPVFLAPMYVRLSLRPGPRQRWGIAGLCALGLFVGGFGVVETCILIILVASAAWAAYRMGFPLDRWRVGAATGSLVAAFLLIELLPGTAVRQAYFSTHQLGLAGVHGTRAFMERWWRYGRLDLKTVLLSPAPILGLATGWLLQHQRASPFRDEAAMIRVLAKPAVAVFVTAWALTALGDAGSYFAVWHLLPLWAILYATFGLCGWRLAIGKHGHPSIRIAVSGLIIGCSAVLATTAATTAWRRRPLFDQDVALVRASRLSERPAEWTATSVGPIGDWPSAIPEWLDVPSSSVR